MATKMQLEADRLHQERDLKERELGEMERSNKEKERLTKRGQNLGFIQKGFPAMKFSKALNDIRWHTKIPAVKQAAMLPFTRWNGQRLPVDGSSINGTTSTVGGLILDFAAIPSCVADRSDPMNLAARELYINIRMKNSGAINYQASDMMQIIQACDSLYTNLAQARRLYRMGVSARNQTIYQFKQIAEQMGYDISTIISNPLDFVGRLNTIIQRANIITIPKDISVIDRHIWMADHLYLDAKTEPSFYYGFNPGFTGFYDWNSKSVKYFQLVDKLNNIRSTIARTSLISAEDLLDIIEFQINKLLDNDDVLTILGDMKKAYPENTLFQFDLVPENWDMTFDLSSEVLDQIRNAVIVNAYTWGNSSYHKDAINYINGTSSTIPVFELAQNPFDLQVMETKTNDLIYDLSANGTTKSDGVCVGIEAYSIDQTVDGDIIASPFATSVHHNILNTTKQIPSPEDVILATRLSVCGGNNATSTKFGLSKYGTEFICYAILSSRPAAVLGAASSGIFDYLRIPGINSRYTWDTSSTSGASETIGTLAVMSYTLAKYHELEYSPTLYIYPSSKTNYTSSLDFPIVVMDSENPTTIDRAQLDNLNTFVILSNYKVPTVSK